MVDKITAYGINQKDLDKHAPMRGCSSGNITNRMSAKCTNGNVSDRWNSTKSRKPIATAFPEKTKSNLKIPEKAKEKVVTDLVTEDEMENSPIKSRINSNEKRLQKLPEKPAADGDKISLFHIYLGLYELSNNATFITIRIDSYSSVIRFSASSWKLPQQSESIALMKLKRSSIAIIVQKSLEFNRLCS
mmetsp:Transcript_9937/g.14868  ORF Transcript_9937/g.14868 Transcript_9937/m.14868 type:complete len:189 (+) Transcript_9937:189-755(+)